MIQTLTPRGKHLPPEIHCMADSTMHGGFAHLVMFDCQSFDESRCGDQGNLMQAGLEGDLVVEQDVLLQFLYALRLSKDGPQLSLVCLKTLL